MENMQYAEELLREFLVFRGFTNTLQAYEAELSTDIGRGFQVDKILDLIFSVYVPKYQADKLVGLLNFFKQCFFSSSEAVLISTLSKLEVSILRYYIVHAIQSGRQDKVVEFFGAYGNTLLLKREDWIPWFAIPYIKNPSLDPQFRVYFSKEWFDALHLSFRNFLSEIFSGIRIPALLKISTEKNTVKRLKNDIKQLNDKLSQLQALLETKEAEILHLKSMASSTSETALISHEKISTSNDGSHSLEDLLALSAAKDDGSNLQAKDLKVAGASFPFQPGETICSDDGIPMGSTNALQESTLSLSKAVVISNSPGELTNIYDDAKDSLPSDNKREMLREDDFPEVRVDFQETFLGHTSPISRCRFSASGSNIASASVDGTVRIWTYDSSTPTSKNATIYCGAEIMSLDWECRSDRLLLIGTADGGIKAWNVDAKRVVCDLNTSANFPSVLDLKCSPVEPVFVSAAASRRQGTNEIDKLGLASLTVWNMKTWKATTVLPLGEDPPAITSLCFNHNGKILAASATDGMIHMFDMSAGLQITGWPAHDAAVSSVLFGPDETSIFSLGSDGKIFEWSLHNQGQILWSRDCSRFCYPESTKVSRHEVGLDFSGRRLLVTSGLVRSPIYQVQGRTSALRTLPHSAAITTVDWHPTLPMFLTGSADHSDSAPSNAAGGGATATNQANKVSVVIFSSSGKMSEYCSPSTSLSKMLEKYQQNSGRRLWDAKHENLSAEIDRVKKENDNMQIELRHLKGEDLNSLNPKELIPIEEVLQNGLTNVRDKQMDFLKMLKKNHHQQLAMNGNVREMELGYHHKDRDYPSQMPMAFRVQPIQPNLLCLIISCEQMYYS